MAVAGSPQQRRLLPSRRRSVQGTPLASVPPVGRSEWSRLGGSIGKLLTQLYRSFAVADVLSGDDSVVGPTANNGQALLEAAAHLLIAEAASRRALRQAAGGAAADGAMSELEARESFGSALPRQLAALVELGAADEAWVTGVGGGVGALVQAAVELMGRPVVQLRQWAGDPEGFACEVMLPAGMSWREEEEEEEEEEGGGYGDDDGADGGEAVEDDFGGGGDEDGGAAGDGDDDDGGGSGWQQSTEAAEDRRRTLAASGREPVVDLAVRSARSGVGGSARLLPTAAATPDEGLDAQISREACYTALGLGAWALEESLSFAQLLTAALAEDAAIHAALQTPARPALAGALQARLCWLISCWWAFGGRGDEAEDARMCDSSYAFLCRQLVTPTADMAVRSSSSARARNAHSYGRRRRAGRNHAARFSRPRRPNSDACAVHRR